MNIKRPLLIIISILLLILLLFFICSDRGALFKDDSSVGPISNIDGIGQMREITPGDEMDDPTGESIPSGRVIDMHDADSQQKKSREVSVRKPSGVSVKKDDSASVKPPSGKSIISGERKVISEKSRTPDTKTAALKDDNAVKGSGLIDKRSETYAAAVKSDTEKDAADSGSFAADNKIKTASGKSEVVPDKPGTGDLKYNRLDRIHLYSGEVLTGAVTVRGDIYTIVTPDGIRRVASRDIQGNDIVK
jgi:hypothetical protein